MGLASPKFVRGYKDGFPNFVKIFTFNMAHIDRIQGSIEPELTESKSISLIRNRSVRSEIDQFRSVSISFRLVSISFDQFRSVSISFQSVSISFDQFQSVSISLPII